MIIIYIHIYKRTSLKFEIKQKVDIKSYRFNIIIKKNIIDKDRNVNFFFFMFILNNITKTHNY
jgi:hypothetical protein